MWDYIIYQEGLFLKKTDSQSLSSHLLPIVFHLGVGLCEVPPIYVSMLLALSLRIFCLDGHFLAILLV